MELLAGLMIPVLIWVIIKILGKRNAGILLKKRREMDGELEKVHREANDLELSNLVNRANRRDGTDGDGAA